MKKNVVIFTLVVLTVIVLAGCGSIQPVAAAAPVERLKLDHYASMYFWENSPYVGVPAVKDYTAKGVITVSKTVTSDDAKPEKYWDIPITYHELMAEAVRLGGDGVINVVVDREELSTYRINYRNTIQEVKWTATALAIKYTDTIVTSDAAPFGSPSGNPVKAAPAPAPAPEAGAERKSLFAQ
jgi:uncharacterized protein YceK